MARVEIAGAGCQVTVEHDGDLAEAHDTARALWDHARTSRAVEMQAGGMGFTTERIPGPVYVTKGDIDL